ncbi:hypothetical protein SKAU_G00249420 [Synaphobranchus kaupii]|uniref:PWWP domain-containing protein n=1 Tax=Synaphobranchus kaupii TaxID=118154 RepID=A0A9Q1F2I6_SYNKA|nr:hypothetical protein SKAU_G00249420 [Synaphobranchus kaupii]
MNSEDTNLEEESSPPTPRQSSLPRGTRAISVGAAGRSSRVTLSMVLERQYQNLELEQQKLRLEIEKLQMEKTKLKMEIQLPSGSVLSSLEQVKTYLLTDGTCKCGLECPLILHKVFNFSPGAAVKQRTAEDVKADEDVTKHCNHKRKIIAVATLHKSATPMVPLRSATPRAIKKKPQEGLPNSISSDCKNPLRMMLSDQRHYQAELSLAQQQELYTSYTRVQLGSAEHGQSPYRGRYCGMLSSASYGDGSLSPRTDPFGSPDTFTRGNLSFHGASSPSPIHGNGRIPLSPPGVLLRSLPVAQAYCAVVGRTKVPLSPTITAKSPVMKKTVCGFPPRADVPRTVFCHKAQIPQAPGPHPQPPPPLPPSCTLQKKQLSSEKDPLGILDPIPSKPVSQSTMAINPNPLTFQPNIESQVPMMNVIIPPAIVPLPSNLPLPTVKPGPMGHGGHVQRVQHAASTSISPSLVTSPAHMTSSGMARVEASPQRSRSSSTSSDHGSFIMPTGPQGPCGSMKVPPRSPRSSMGSPHPSLPSSPSTKPDPLHQYKDVPSQLLVGMNNSMFSPGSAGNGPQKGHPGLLGMPLNKILTRHNAASFPASSLLSAAAKAQLANQNKLTGGGSGGNGVNGGNGGNSSNPGLVSSCGGMADGHSTLNTPMFPPNPGIMLPTSEGQSGRAALRDKLMAQQRDPLRKRKQLISGSNCNNMVFSMLKSQMGCPRHPGPVEQLRTGARTASLPSNTSMAQLLQSMSCQSSHMAGGNTSVCMGLNQDQLQFGEGAMQTVQAQHRLHCREELHSRGYDSRHPVSGMVNQMQVTPTGNCRLLGPASLGNPSSGHPNPHPHRLTHHNHEPQGCCYILGRANMVSTLPNCNGSCSQTILEPDDTLNCSVNNPKLGNLQPHNSSQMFQQMGQPQLIQGFQETQGFQFHAFPENPFPDSSSSSPMACLFQNFQGSLPESISDPNKQTSTHSVVTLHPKSAGIASLPQLRDSLHELQPQALGPSAGPHGLEGLPGGGGETVDAIYRAVVDTASKGTHVVITTTVSGTTQANPVPALSAMSAFTASIGEPINLSRAVNAVIHGHRGAHQEVHPQVGHPRKNSEHGKCTPEEGEAHKFFRSPSRRASRGQWDEAGLGPGMDSHAPWQGHEFLECSTHVRSSPPTERANTVDPTGAPQEHKHPSPTLQPGDKAFLEEGFHFNNCKQATLNFKERPVEHCTHMNGGPPPVPTLLGRGYGDILGPPRQDLMAEDHSPGSSTSLEGPLVKDHIHYNGHYNGCAPSPSDTKSLSSEEDLRQPDSPSSNELLHYQPQTFNMGDLVWGQLKSFPPWPVKLMNEDQVHNPGMENSEQDKVEPERLKTLTEDLEALNKATKRNRKGGKLNNHLEAAIHEAMSELDKMSGSVFTRCHRETDRSRGGRSLDNIECVVHQSSNKTLTVYIQSLNF